MEEEKAHLCEGITRMMWIEEKGDDEDYIEYV